MLKLICEADFYDLQLIEEQQNVHGKRSMKIRGPYIVTETVNANGREYKQNVMEKAVELFDKNFIQKNRAVGEMNHPTTTEVDFNNACHKIISMKQKDNIWYGESQVLLGTPKGDLLAGLLSNNVQVGISTRGVGNITENKIVDEYQLIAADVVYEPSGPGCMLEGILESKNYMINEHGDIVEMAYDIVEKTVKTLPIKTNNRNGILIETIAKFLNSI